MNADAKKQVFVSYSTKDAAKANAICAALEAAGVSCWIAPRDLSAGTQWGGGIVDAIDTCSVVLVVFSSASNDSPQVAREMELSVSKRRPLIPVRVEDAMPTQDMQFFLGVSHWFNAYPEPIETYLPQIVGATERVLHGQAHSWSGFSRRIPSGSARPLAIAAGCLVLAVLAAAWMMRPKDPAEAYRIPLAGRWQTEIDGATGKAKCVLDVQATGQAAYSEDCPAPLQSASGSLSWTKDGVWAPNQYQNGDTGTFLFQGGSAHGYAAAFRVGGRRLVTRDVTLHDLTWKKIAADKPMTSASADILPASASWPLQGVPAMAAKATDYARGHWRKDAVLMSVDVKLIDGASGGSAGLSTPDGAVEVSFQFYSPEAQKGMQLTPGSAAGAMFVLGAEDQTVAEAVPQAFVDLPQAVDAAHQSGMRGKQVKEAKLEWSGGDSCGTGNFRIDNAILPRCPPNRFIGPQWQIDSALGERRFIPAAR